MSNKVKYWWLGCLLVSLPILVSQTFYFVNKEQVIYIWDYKNYWEQWQHFSVLLNTPSRLASLILLDIYFNSVYNASPIATLIPFYYLPFGMRTNYILGISLLYFLPLLLLINRFLLTFKCYQSYLWMFVITLLVVTFVPFWGPILRGYPDIVGLIPIVGVVFFVMSHDLTSDIKLKNILIIGVLLWLPFLLRRWYAYTIVSLYITLPFLNLFLFNKLKAIKFKELASLFGCFFAAGLVSLGFLYIFQSQVVSEIVGTSYAQVYSAYQFGFVNSIAVLYGNVGLLVTLFFLFGFIGALKSERTTEKIFVIFCVVNLVISFSLFARTQTPGIHHCLPFSLWIFFVSIMGLKVLLNSVYQDSKKIAILTSYVCLSVLIGVVTFNKTKLDYISDNALFPSKIYPLQLANYDNYLSLVNELQRLTKKGDYVSVLSSSDILTDELLSVLSKHKLNIVYGSQVDLRDRLALDIFQTRYIVIADPVQLHLNPDGQRVVSIPVEQILNQQTIGAAYKKLPQEYLLDNNVKAYVYYKTRSFTEAEMNQFVSKFIKIYPEWQAVYSKDKLKKLTGNTQDFFIKY